MSRLWPVGLPRFARIGSVAFWTALLLAPLLGSAVTGRETGPTTAGSTGIGARPNIVFILLDDLGYADLGVYGSQFIQTPYIDAFAQSGIQFTQYYAGAAVCAPSRAAVLAGRYHQLYGIRTNLHGNNRRGVHDYVVAEFLRDQGYATAHVGKWHLGRLEGIIPVDQGFDLDVRFETALTGLLQTYFDPPIVINDTELVEHTGHLTEILTDYAIDFVTDNAAGPFFLNLWYSAPHEPLEPTLDWAAQYPDTDEGRFAGLVSGVDEQIGRLLRALDDLGIADNTLIVLTSDNGGDATWHGDDPATGPSNGIYRVGKGQVYEGGIRVPMIARWNGVTPPGTVDDSILAGFDFFATFAEILGADPAGLGLEGESMLSVLQGAGPKARSGTLFFETKASPNDETDPEAQTWNQYAIRRDRWKLLYRDGELQLYDIGADPSETTNLVLAEPLLVDELLVEHHDWRFAHGLIPHEILETRGEVVIVDDEWTFDGGAVRLEFNPLYDPDDLDFSFVATITPSSIGDGQTVARFGTVGAGWRLELLPSGALGLQMFGQAGQELRLRTNTVLRPGTRYKVAFSVFGWPGTQPTVVRLYLDGTFEVEADEDLTEVAEVAGAFIGNLADLSRPFIGTIEELQLWSLALNPAEVLELTGS